MSNYERVSTFVDAKINLAEGSQEYANVEFLRALHSQVDKLGMALKANPDHIPIYPTFDVYVGRLDEDDPHRKYTHKVILTIDCWRPNK